MLRAISSGAGYGFGHVRFAPALSYFSMSFGLRQTNIARVSIPVICELPHTKSLHAVARDLIAQQAGTDPRLEEPPSTGVFIGLPK